MARAPPVQMRAYQHTVRSIVRILHWMRDPDDRRTECGTVEGAERAGSAPCMYMSPLTRRGADMRRSGSEAAIGSRKRDGVRWVDARGAGRSRRWRENSNFPRGGSAMRKRD
jgi:hypothetical protein